MTQRLFNLSKWTPVQEGSSLHFDNQRRRTVILEVNVPNPCLLFIQEAWEGTGKVKPLAVEDDASEDVKPHPGRRFRFLCSLRAGRDRIEFGVDGAFELVPVGGEVMVWSNDSDRRYVTIIDPLIYTQIANRRVRNPQMELMMWEMQQNQKARDAELREEFERRLKEVATNGKRYTEPRNHGKPVGSPVEDPASDGPAVVPGETGTASNPTGAPEGEGAASGGIPPKAPIPKGAPDARAKAKPAK